MLRSEKESYMRERAAEAARVETISGEYDDMRRRAAVTEAGLSGCVTCLIFFDGIVPGWGTP